MFVEFGIALCKLFVRCGTASYKFAISIHDDIDTNEHRVFTKWQIQSIEILPQFSIHLL